MLVLLSDGVIEAARAASSDLGPERLAAVVRAPGRRPPRPTLLAALQAAAEEGLGGARRADDHTFVVLRRVPAGGERGEVGVAEGMPSPPASYPGRGAGR